MLKFVFHLLLQKIQPHKKKISVLCYTWILIYSKKKSVIFVINIILQNIYKHISRHKQSLKHTEKEFEYNVEDDIEKKKS